MTVFKIFNPKFASSSRTLRVVLGKSRVKTGDHPLDVTGVIVLGEDLDKLLSIHHNIP